MTMITLSALDHVNVNCQHSKQTSQSLLRYSYALEGKDNVKLVERVVKSKLLPFIQSVKAAYSL